MNSKKLLSILGLAGVVVHSAGTAVSIARASASPSALEQILQNDPTGEDASAAFDILAEKKGNGRGNSDHDDDGPGNGSGNGNGHHHHGHGNGHGHDHDDDDDDDNPGHYEG